MHLFPPQSFSPGKLTAGLSFRLEKSLISALLDSEEEQGINNQAHREKLNGRPLCYYCSSELFISLASLIIDNFTQSYMLFKNRLFQIETNVFELDR